MYYCLRKRSSMMKRVFVILSAFALMALIAMPAVADDCKKPSPGERIFKALDKNSDGKICKEEAPERLKAAFEKIDADKDGGITPAEMKAAFIAKMKEMKAKHEAAMKARGCKPPKMPSVADLIKKVDKDGNGKVSKEECPKEHKAGFDKVDANGDGQVCEAELKAAIIAKMKAMRESHIKKMREMHAKRGEGHKHHHGHHRKPPCPAEIIKKLDTNKDGKVCKDEARGPMKDHFDKIDANDDGGVSAD